MANSTQKLSKDGSPYITDERVNTITHLVGMCFALLGTLLLVVPAILHKDVWKIISFSLYGFSLLSLFTFSTLHHGLNGGPRLTSVMRTFDYNAVFLLIAGTTTPLALLLYRDVVGSIVLSTVWIIAILGIVLRSVFRTLPKYVTNTLYITLGWLPVSLLLYDNRLQPAALVLLALGGITYTLGFIVFASEKPNFVPGIFGFHELWHVLVLVGAGLHFWCMYAFLLP